MRRILRALACALPLLAAACGDSTGPNEDLRRVNFAPALGVDIASMTRVGDGVYFRDIAVGTGPLVEQGRRLDVRYRGWLANGTLFESNFDASQPFQMVLGLRRVIKGWEQGIPGMRVGGTRLLAIPPSLAYGSQGSGPIPANAVLVFEVKVEAMQ